MLGIPHLSLLIVNEKQQLTKPSSVEVRTGPALEALDDAVGCSVSEAPGPEDEEVLTPAIPAPITPEAEDPTGPLRGELGLILS